MIQEESSLSAYYSLTPVFLEACMAKKSIPVQTVEEIKGSRTVVVPVTKFLKTKVPITKAVQTQVPVQRVVHGTRQVVTNVTVNRPKFETYTKMVPVQATRIVPTVEKHIKKIPTINYITDYVTKIDYVTELQEKLKTITEYETRQIPTIRKRIRTHYETVEELPEQDLIC